MFLPKRDDAARPIVRGINALVGGTVAIVVFAAVTVGLVVFLSPVFDVVEDSVRTFFGW